MRRFLSLPNAIAAAVIAGVVIGLTLMVTHLVSFSVSEHPADGADVAGIPAVPAQAPTQSPRPIPSLAPVPNALNPKSLALQAMDVGSGFTVVTAGPAATAGGGHASTSWDQVFQRGGLVDQDFRLDESLVIVYPNQADAEQALAQQADLAAARVTSPLEVSVGQHAIGSIESVPGHPDLSLARLTFRVGAVVAQVTVLGRGQEQLSQEAVSLAGQEVRRLIANGAG